eukprot:941685-Amphidinium_carterae.1
MHDHPVYFQHPQPRLSDILLKALKGRLPGFSSQSLFHKKLHSIHLSSILATRPMGKLLLSHVLSELPSCMTQVTL